MKLKCRVKQKWSDKPPNPPPPKKAEITQAICEFLLVASPETLLCYCFSVGHLC